MLAKMQENGGELPSLKEEFSNTDSNKEQQQQQKMKTIKMVIN